MKWKTTFPAPQGYTGKSHSHCNIEIGGRGYLSRYFGWRLSEISKKELREFTLSEDHQNSKKSRSEGPYCLPHTVATSTTIFKNFCCCFGIKSVPIFVLFDTASKQILGDEI